jgi:CHAT domain-containing protein
MQLGVQKRQLTVLKHHWTRPQLQSVDESDASVTAPHRATRGALILGLMLATAAPSARAATPARCKAPPPPTPALPAEDPEAALAAGTESYRRGDIGTAAAHWESAARGFAAADRPAREAEARVRLARAQQAAGRLGAAAESVDRARASAERAGKTAKVGAVLAATGDVALGLNQLDPAQQALDAAADRASGDPALGAVVQNSLGTLAARRGETTRAIEHYERATSLAEKAERPTLAASAEANALRAAAEGAAADEPSPELPSPDLGGRLAAVLARTEALPDSDAKARALIQIGRTHERLYERASDPALLVAGARALREGALCAERTGSARTASWGWGWLGGLYAGQGRSDDAVKLTRRAMFAAQSAAAPDALYLWQYQLGRLQRERGETQDGTESLRAAVRTLDALRVQSPFGFASSDESFDASVAPIYQDLVDLLLRQAAASSGEQAEALVREARDVVERAKVAELRDYFRDECVVEETATAPDAIPGTVVVYPVLLPDRTELIVSGPRGLHAISVPVGQAELTEQVRSMRRLLQRLTTRQYRVPAQQLYDWLIRPIEQTLADPSVTTLVFVPAGPLRTIPPGALYDRESKQFLIEKYPIAVTPGLALTDPRSIDASGVEMLIAGLTQAVQGYPALPSVGPEVSGIREMYSNRTLLDEEFRSDAFESELVRQPFGIVHVASHGEFGGESADSFVLTWDGRLTIDELSRLVGISAYGERSLELLTLSACQTAAGNDRAALGLAGVAVRSGARSALATLWYVSDEASSDLVKAFYAQLRKPGVQRAEALRRAQMGFIEDPSYRHPGYWSPFLLIGSWL